MKPKLIKTEADCQAALARIEEIFDSAPGTPAGDELELLSALVEMFEEKAYPIDLPDPLEAIRFRMEQAGLKAKDLVPFIGSASKVSEVLSGKRALSLTMIRSLVAGLGIPAEVLLQAPGAKLPPSEVLEQARQFPLSEMVKRGWFPGFEGSLGEARSQREELLTGFVAPLGKKALVHGLNRQHVRDGSAQDEHALAAWRIRVATLALRQSAPAFTSGTVTEGFLLEVAHLSFFDSGPLLAREFLCKNGIRMVCERHLPKTHLDGAALRLPDGSPMVALTLRHDRLDNFWFTLFHELAHVALHLQDGPVDAFFDDLSAEGRKDKCEKEADQLASEMLIPASEWKLARLTRRSSPREIIALAEKLRISPAIPAGRVRHAAADYTVFKSLIGSGRVRTMFGVEGD